jgi:ABC-type sugar transport system substrate-binding protein
MMMRLVGVVAATAGLALAAAAAAVPFAKSFGRVRQQVRSHCSSFPWLRVRTGATHVRTR